MKPKGKKYEILLCIMGAVLAVIASRSNASFSDTLILELLLWIPALVITAKRELSSPFLYPYYEKSFDVSGKRQPNIEEYIEQFICDGGFAEFESHKQTIYDWNLKCESYIQSSPLKRLRQKQYEQCKDDEHAYRFYFTRNQTRYIQRNYVRSSYQVNQAVDLMSCDYEWLTNKYKQLETISFETTLKKYHSKEQRKLMTREFRESIMKRDNYTCQICGKYMPDEVGLEVDHIIPIAKGGKSISSNLQVLCSKCNGHKSDKTA